MDVMHESKRVAPPAGNKEVTLLICLDRQVFDFPRNRETAGSLWGPPSCSGEGPCSGWVVCENRCLFLTAPEPGSGL